MSRKLNELGRIWITSKWCSSLSRNGCRPNHFVHASSFTVRNHVSPTSSIGLRTLCSSSKLFLERKEGTVSESEALGRQDDDRIKLFIDPRVQSILKDLTGRDLRRIFRKRKIGQKIREPKYTFMTEQQLEDARKEAEEKADKLLQMPPVLRAREPVDEVLSFDPYIQGEEMSTLIFTDITMNVLDRDRIIVARDPDGTLRQATWEERDKMNSIYFPVTGRELVTPRMFSEPEALLVVLNRASNEDNAYEFVLDRACVQFEPDNPLYIRTVETTYDVIDQKGHYDFLKSTRHYGPMVFYLVRTRKMDGILLYSLKHDRVTSDAAKLVSLFQIMFPQCKSAQTKAVDEIDRVRQYIQLDAIKKGELELALNAYVEEEVRKHELTAGLQRQHGIQ